MPGSNGATLLLHPSHRPTYNRLTSPSPVTERSPSVSRSAVHTATKQLHREPADRHADAIPYQDLAHVFSLVFGTLAAIGTWREMKRTRTP